MKYHRLKNASYLTHFFRKPIVLFKIARSYLNYFLFKKVAPRYFDIAIGYECNLKCKHCFDVNMRRESKMQVDEYRTFAGEAAKEGSFIFYFQGGEIFIIRGFEEIIQAFSPRKNIIGVTTNGYFATEENLKKLKRIGVDIVVFSIDSGIAEEHDAFRGKEGVFSRVIDGVKRAKEMNFIVSVNTALSHANIRSQGIDVLFTLLRGFDVKVNTIFAAPVGNWARRDDILLTNDDITYYDTVLRKKYPFLNRDLDNNFSPKPGCPAGKEVFFLDPYGNLLPCPFIHLSMGNVRQESFSSILARIKKIQFLKPYHSACLIAENRDFIDGYAALTKEKSVPLPVDEHISLPY